MKIEYPFFLRFTFSYYEGAFPQLRQALFSETSNPPILGGERSIQILDLASIVRVVIPQV
jgi:hypothetical protein